MNHGRGTLIQKCCQAVVVTCPSGVLCAEGLLYAQHSAVGGSETFKRQGLLEGRQAMGLQLY